MLKKGKLIPLIFSGVTAAAVSLATVSCSFEQNPLTIEGPYEYMVETGGKIQPETDYDPYKVELHEAQVKTGVTMSINPISYIGDEVWDYIAINEEGYLYTKDGFTADEPRTLTFTVHAEYKDEKENKNYECDSAIVSIAIVEPSGKQAVIDGGESYIPLKYGNGHETDTPFTMLVNDELQSGVEFSLVEIDPDAPIIPGGIDVAYEETTEDPVHTEAVIRLDGTTPVGEYTFKIQGTITPDGDDDIVASANVTVVVSENEYVMSGGSTSLELFAGDTNSDSIGAWTLEKDGGDITDSATFSFAGNPPWIHVSTGGAGEPAKNTVYWANVPAEAAKAVILQAKVSGSVVAEIEIPISIKAPVYGFEIDGADEVVDQMPTAGYGIANVRKDPSITGTPTIKEWHTDNANVSIDETTGELTSLPSQAAFDVDIWPEITLVLHDTYSITINADGKYATKTVHVVPPYEAEDSTKTYCWGDLDSSSEAAWWELDETATTTFAFKKVGAEGAATEVTKSTFNSPIYFGKERAVVNTDKLNGAALFNSDITFPSQPFGIGDDFLLGCESYSIDPAESPNWTNYGYCTSIGNSFMYGCTAVQGMYIPSTVVSVGLDFMVNCEGLMELQIRCPISVFNQDSDMTLTVDTTECWAYVEGVKIINVSGASIVSDFESMFPEILESAGLGYYRNYLVD